MEKRFLEWTMELQSIAQVGLAYSKDPYDLERYQQLMHLATTMSEYYSGVEVQQITRAFAMQSGYATPKVDVRAVIVEDNRILLARERQDDLWTLPGGWAEVTLSPAENVIKEVKEETGYNVEVLRLVALWDKLKHDHPPQWPHAYKCFFQCNIIGGEATSTLETSDVQWFALDQLPPLSTPRVTATQIQALCRIIRENLVTAYD